MSKNAWPVSKACLKETMRTPIWPAWESNSTSTVPARNPSIIKKRRLELQEEVKDVTSEDFAAMRTAVAAGPAQKLVTSGGKRGEAWHAQEVGVEWYKRQAKKLKQQVTCIGSECHSLDVLVTSIEGQPDSEMKPIALKHGGNRRCARQCAICIICPGSAARYGSC